MMDDGRNQHGGDQHGGDQDIGHLLKLVEIPEYLSMIQPIIDHLPCGVAVFDPSLNMVVCNGVFRRLLDLPDELFTAGLPSLKKLATFAAERGEYGPGNPEELAEQVVQRAMAMEPNQFERVRPDETILEIDERPLPNGGFVTLYTDITERRALAERSRDLEALNLELTNTVAALAASNAELHAAREELEHLAQRDGLTGAWTRRRIEETAQQEMLRKARYGHPVSLLFIDLDHFKRVNDTHGHAVGDDVLKAFCNIARKCMRSTDLLGRWGGEEFVILMPNSGVMIASLLAERIRKATMAFEFPIVGRVTTSLGIAECREDETWDSWLARSDAALYAAKAGGRNQVIKDAAHAGEAGEAELLDLAYMRLGWRKAYESGHSLIDSQHRDLFDLANNLLTSVIGDRPDDEVVPQVESLVADLTKHFHDEEVIFRSVGYSSADDHAEIHRSLIIRANNLVENFKQGELSVGELFNYIAYDFIAKHMLSEDRKFFGLIQADSMRQAES